MNRSIRFILPLVSLLFSLFIPQVVAAENSTNVSISNNGEGSTSNVNVNTNTGNNTICQNGKCTTSDDGDGKSTVCINGKCSTSSGSMHVESDDGHSKVSINNDKDADDRISLPPFPSITITIPASPSAIPTINEDEIKKQVEENHNALVKEIEQLKQFIEKQINDIKKVFGL